MAAFFTPKAKKWVEGRRNIFIELAKEFPIKKRVIKQKVIWVHCASLGEFEQGRVLIESFKYFRKNAKILLTFYSPSGYEIRKDYKNADWVYYLPRDSKKNAERFLEIVQPDLAVFVKYEFWFHYLNQLSKRQIPTYLISAIFRSKQPFFKPYGILHRRMLDYFNHTFVQNESSFQLLNQINYQQKTIAGDTRIDRVVGIQNQKRTFPGIEKFCKKGTRILIAGSTWDKDESILTSFINKPEYRNYKLIIAPHSITEDRILSIEHQLNVPFLRYSKAKEKELESAQVLIIDNIGMLAFLYEYGDIAFIGGAFGSGLHNILEPAATGIPIIFGKKYGKFQEAKDLVKSGGAFSIKNETAFIAKIKWLEEEANFSNSAQKCLDYLKENQGATERILKHILEDFI